MSPMEQKPGSNQPPPQDYKLGSGYMGVLQEAKQLVSGAEGKRAIRKAAFEKAMEAASDEGQEPAKPGILERHLPDLLAFFKKPWAWTFLRWTARLILLCAVAWQGNRLRLALSSEDMLLKEPEDVLISIDENAPDYDGVKNYAQYIVNKVGAGGMEAVAGKWIDGIDPSFKEDAKAPLELLSGGFKIGRVSADKAIVYNVECHPDVKPERAIVIEVVKGRLSSGRAVYRLQRVY